MISEDRKNKILEIIDRSGYIRVEKLAEKLYTSASTVRRNLSELEGMGLVKRSYGGVEMNKEGIDLPVWLRHKKNHTAKMKIAEKAAKLLRDGMTVFVDASSTCLYLIPYIEKLKGIIVYTNSIEVCSMLAKSGVEVYCVGGKLHPQSLAFAGEYAINMIESLYFDALFFSCSGFDGDIITDYSEKETHLRHSLLKHSDKKYFMCDSSKIGKRFTYITCRLKDITTIITEND